VVRFIVKYTLNGNFLTSLISIPIINDVGDKSLKDEALAEWIKEFPIEDKIEVFSIQEVLL
jgi:hypothetical protein